MQYFRVTNAGEVEAEAFTLLGASSKGGDTDKIGYFGSGNKYALAVLLRNGYGIRIFSGEREITIGTTTTEFRGNSFEQICINGTPTGLTTRMGPDWKPWMALRELVCNALDEGDAHWELVDSEPMGCSGETAVFVEVDQYIEDYVSDFSTIVLDGLPEKTLCIHDTDVSLYEGSDGRVYRKGVCCVDPGFYKDKKSLYRYSFSHQDITESRLAYDWEIRANLARTVAAFTDTEDIKDVLRIITGSEGYIENKADWSTSYIQFSSEWHEVLKAVGKPFIAEALYAYLPLEDHLIYCVLPDDFAAAVREAFPDLPFCGDENGEFIETAPGTGLEDAVAKGIADLKSFGISFDMHLVYGKFASSEMLMQCDDKNNTCRVSATYLTDSSTPIREGLLEELTHLTTGYSDGSRALANHYLHNWVETMDALRVQRAQIVELEKNKDVVQALHTLKAFLGGM